MSLSARSQCSFVPRPFQKSGKSVWCSEWHFLSHGARLYFVKNVIIACLYLELKFLMPQSIWTYYKSSRWPQSLLEQPKTCTLRDMFPLFPIRFKIRSLTSCNCNQVFCILIGDLKSKISPAPCDNDTCARARGSGHETNLCNWPLVLQTLYEAGMKP